TGSVAVGKASQAITFGAIADKVATDAAFTPAATGGGSGVALVFSTTSTACSVSGNTVTLVTSGSCAIQADQAGDANYNAAPAAIQTFNVTKATQTITFPAVDTFVWKDGSATLRASASSGLAVAYSVVS